MRKQFSLERNKVIINFSSNYCDTSEKLLNSQGFSKVLSKYIEHIKVKNTSVYRYLNQSNNNKNLVLDMISLFKLLLVLEIEDITNIDNHFHTYLEDKKILSEFIEDFYNDWRRLERYTLVYNKYYGEGIQKTKFIESNNLFSDLVLTTYRIISEKINGDHYRVYRQLVAGGNAGLILNRVKWKIPIGYEKLMGIPFIESIVLHPPFITYPKRSKRTGVFEEVYDNPLIDLDFDSEEWFCYPAYIGKSLAYLFFHKDFMNQGVSLCNLFDLVPINECKNTSPDLLFVYGYKDEKQRTHFYCDKQLGMYIGYISYSEEFDYFGYMKKMSLTLHNIKMIEEKKLPIHGAMVHIILKNDKKFNIVIIGDSGAGKSESLEALRVIGHEYIKDMKVIFDDMGSFFIEDDCVKANGTEIGAFIRLDDLEIGYAYREIDRSIFMNPDKTNSRVVIPVATYQDIIMHHPVDMVFYANNYDDGEPLSLFKDKEEAIHVFKQGRRKAKGTTTESGLVETYFANPFGPMQRHVVTDELIEEYFSLLFKNNIPVGQIRTRLAIDGCEHTGPRRVALKLFEFIQNEV